MIELLLGPELQRQTQPMTEPTIPISNKTPTTTMMTLNPLEDDDDGESPCTVPRRNFTVGVIVIPRCAACAFRVVANDPELIFSVSLLKHVLP